MVKKGYGHDQKRKEQFAKNMILKVLRDGKKHRSMEIEKQAQVSPTTLSKHLKDFEESHLVEKTIDLKSDYPYPVYYQLKMQIHQVLSWAWAQASSNLLKRGDITKYMHCLNYSNSLSVLGYLRIYAENPKQNEKMIDEAIEHFVISLFQEDLQRLKGYVKNQAEKGKNMDKVLAQVESDLEHDYEDLAVFESNRIDR